MLNAVMKKVLYWLFKILIFVGIVYWSLILGAASIDGILYFLPFDPSNLGEAFLGAAVAFVAAFLFYGSILGFFWHYYFYVKNKNLETNKYILLGFIIVVTVFGVFTYRMIQTEMVDVDGNSANKAVSSENWQTYKNSELGFEFRYPDKWIIEYESNENIYNQNNEKIPARKSLVIQSDNYKFKEDVVGGVVGIVDKIQRGAILRITADPETYYRTPQEFLEKEKATGGTTKEIPVSKYSVYESAEANGNRISTVTFFIPNPNVINSPILFEVSIDYSAKDKETYEKVLDQLLSTFRINEG